VVQTSYVIILNLKGKKVTRIIIIIIIIDEYYLQA